MSLVTLTTDFGLRDGYVAQVKGAMLSIAADLVLIDVTHEIGPQDVSRAACVLDEAAACFPPGTVHLAVVDPGVGTPRRAVAVETSRARYVAPDNGLLMHVVRREGLVQAVELVEPRFRRTAVSSVFHGRDVFGPVAAHWASGVPIAQFGPPLESPLVEIAEPQPFATPDRIVGRVAWIDGFGNLVTDIPSDLLTAAEGPFAVRIAGTTIPELVRCYGERPRGALVALVGSHGRLEVAVVDGDAARVLGAARGDTVEVDRRARSSA